LQLTNEQYGDLERAFVVTFALGSLLMGGTVDRWNVRWVYPAALLAWSAAGFLTGSAQSFLALTSVPLVLDFFEAGSRNPVTR